MSALHTLARDGLELVVAAHGAQMQHLRLDGREYLWQGDPAYWPDRAINLFPYIARLTGGRYIHRGRVYRMDIHGFAKDREWTALPAGENALAFELCSDEQTLLQYPFAFRCRISYRLEGRRVVIAHEVENRGAEPMYFGLGGHPGFQVPLEGDLDFSDYHLEFARPGNPRRILFSEDLFVRGSGAFPLEEGNRLPLAHALFDQDAIVLWDAGGAVTLRADRGERGVHIDCPGFAYLGIWHPPRTDAPFVCLEPWSSLPSRQGVVEDLVTQPDLIRLPEGEVYRNEWSIGLF